MDQIKQLKEMVNQKDSMGSSSYFAKLIHGRAYDKDDKKQGEKSYHKFLIILTIFIKKINRHLRYLTLR